MSIYPRAKYEMSDEDLKEILDACKPTPAMIIMGDLSPQRNANSAWQNLADKMGFDWETVRPIDGKGNKFFTAVPLENQTQKEERIKREERDFRRGEIERLESEIYDKQLELRELTAHKGDPCEYCGKKHDEVEVGPCPERI
jgi:DNA repair exonuclease SbcCD ATPase subunit